MDSLKGLVTLGIDLCANNNEVRRDSDFISELTSEHDLLRKINMTVAMKCFFKIG
jgi:hypothetical protein